MSQGSGDLLSNILDQDLGALWHHALQSAGLLDSLPPATIVVLLDAGYSVHAEPANISHEATFRRGAVDIDLHWHLLRPGRTRVDLTAELLARRQRIKGQWGLSDLLLQSSSKRTLR